MATQKRGLRRIGSVIGGAFALSGLAGLIGGLGHEACAFSAFSFLRAALGSLASVILAVCQLLLPCLFDHARLLESLLQVTAGSWQLIVAFACAA
jgi:hypothetical protein